MEPPTTLLPSLIGGASVGGMVVGSGLIPLTPPYNVTSPYWVAPHPTVPDGQEVGKEGLPLILIIIVVMKVS